MKFLFASDSFKGTLTSEKIIELLTESAKRVFPECVTSGIQVADGGEGTVEAIIAACCGQKRYLTVHGPLMEKLHSFYGRLQEKTAVIEMAAASGLPLVPPQKRNPLHTTSYGTGELIADALENGCKHLVVAIGGSATNDGGMGAMKALGIRFLDGGGRELKGTGADLIKLRDIDMSGLHPAAAGAEFTVLCDVKNPLTGPKGAVYTFGRQKGGSPEVLDQLEAGMKNYAAVIHDKLGKDVDNLAGAGAAGGLGAALWSFLGAQLSPGVETVLDLIDFNSFLADVDLVVTGEGRMDWQSAYGKVPGGVAKRCRERNIPVAAIVGGMGPGAENMYQFGIDSVLPTINGAMGLEEAMERSVELYINAADRLFRLLRMGSRLHI